MRKRLALVGIFVIIIFVVFSGCSQQDTNQQNERNTISLQSLNDYIADYAGKTITVQGYIGQVIGKGWNNLNYKAVLDESSWQHNYNNVNLTVPFDIDIYSCLTYYITGIAREPETYGDNPIIEVSSVELCGSLLSADDLGAEEFWSNRHSEIFLDQQLASQSEDVYKYALGLTERFQGIVTVNADAWINCISCDGRKYCNGYVFQMEFNGGDISDINNWNLLNVTQEIDKYSDMPD